jgi:hypothetical protein
LKGTAFDFNQARPVGQQDLREVKQVMIIITGCEERVDGLVFAAEDL